MIKVMIADDQELIRQSLQIVLEMKEGIEVTATAKDGREVINVRVPNTRLLAVGRFNFCLVTVRRHT